MDALFLFGVVVTIVVSTMSMLKLVAIRDSIKTREYARSIGIEIIQCRRNIPYWTSKDFSVPPKFRKNKKSYGYCSKYKNPQSDQWSLLQRTSEPNSEFPPAWQLVIDKGEMNEKIKTLLLEIAKKHQKNYLEIVSTENNLCIYWEEFGRHVMADKIQAHLTNISAIMDSDTSDNN